MKQLLTVIMSLIGTVAFAQIPGADKLNKVDFEAGFNDLIQSYFTDCYNDSTKVEVHRQLTPDEYKKDPCTIAWINQGTGFSQICENKRHSEIKYVHAEPRDFGRFLMWVEERRKQDAK